jgi:hypothetical protein
MFHLFQTYIASVCYLNVAHVSHLCYKSMFEILPLFQSYVGVSVFVLQFATVLSGCCICIAHILQLYVPNVSFALVICYIQVFHVLEIESSGGQSYGVEAFRFVKARFLLGYYPPIEA